MYYTYVLLSEQDDEQYVCYAQNIKLRFEQHKMRRRRIYKIEDLFP